MERKLLVPTVVVVGIMISMLAIVPIAVADREDDDDDDDEESCRYWFFKAFKGFQTTGYVPVEIKHKVRECLAEGIKSPWKLPDMDENPQSPALTGLHVEFMETTMEVPVGSGTPFNPSEEITEVHPCPSGEIVIGDLQVVSVSSKTSLEFELQEDKTTLIMKTKNKDTTPDTLVLLAPCLGLIGN